jgi:hypothetical protein
MLLNENECSKIEFDTHMQQTSLPFGLFARFLSQDYGTVTLQVLERR